MVLPSEYLSAVWGDDFSFDSNYQATHILGLLMRHWNTISSELLRKLKHPDVYLPVLLQGDEGVTRGNDWARGFMRGVQTRPASWRELIVSDEHGGSLLPIMIAGSRARSRSARSDPRSPSRPTSAKNCCR